MKKLILSLAIVMITVAASAQDLEGFKVQAGINLAIPVLNLGFSSIGAGVDLSGIYGITEKVALTGDVGYTSLFGKNNIGNLGLVPVRVGVRYFTSENFYIAGKGGLIFTTNGGGYSAAAYSAGVGYMLSPSLDLGASYDGYSKNGSAGYANIRLGYTFGKN